MDIEINQIQKNNFERVLDLLLIFFLLISFETIVSFTIVSEYLHGIILVLYISYKSFFQKKFFLKELFWRYQWLTIMSILAFLLPLVISGYNHEVITKDLPWLNSSNSWRILLSYFPTLIFFKILDDIDFSKDDLISKIFKYINNKKVELVSIIFLSSIIPETIYSFVRFFRNNGERFQGSSSNPQLYAIELALLILVLIMSWRSLKIYLKTDLPLKLILILIILNSLASGSISNFIGLIFVSFIWILNSGTIALAIAFTVNLLVNSLGLYWLINLDRIDMLDLKEDLGIFASKIIPRLNLWLKSIPLFDLKNFNYLRGIGYSAYYEVIFNKTGIGQVHIHNLFFHNLLTGGFLGIYSVLMWFIHHLKLLCSNKYLCSIAIYLLISGLFECGSIYDEVQTVFWRIFPFIIISSEYLELKQVD
jgi:hypothetical protein